VVLAGLVVAAGAVALCLFSLTAAGGALAASHGAARAAYRGMKQVVVEPGESLWSIASAAEPGADPRVVVQEIMQVNALSGVTVQVGQQLWVPKG
jgi:LysM repeat protein